MSERWYYSPENQEDWSYFARITGCSIELTRQFIFNSRNEVCKQTICRNAKRDTGCREKFNSRVDSNRVRRILFKCWTSHVPNQMGWFCTMKSSTLKPGNFVWNLTHLWSFLYTVTSFCMIRLNIEFLLSGFRESVFLILKQELNKVLCKHNSRACLFRHSFCSRYFIGKGWYNIHFGWQFKTWAFRNVVS